VSLLDFLLSLVHTFSWLAVYTGIRRWKQLDSGQKATWCWLLMAAVFNSGMSILTNLGYPTMLLGWATYPIYAAVGTYALTALRPADRIRNWLWIGFGGYCLVWLIAGSPGRGFPSVSAPLLWLLLSLCATTLLISRLRETRAPLGDFGALIAIGTLVSYLPSIALEPLGTIIYPSNPDLFQALWRGKEALHVIGAAIWFRAFVVGIPRR